MTMSAPADSGRSIASPVSVLLLGGLLAAALAGVFGGGKASIAITEAPAARLTVKSPQVLRNGTFFETRLYVTAQRDITDLVLAVEPGLWRDMTVNTMIPAASEEAYKDGAFRFRYGTLESGDTLEIKIDGQINPPLFAGTRGAFAVLDGKVSLARASLKIRVLP